VTISPDSRPEKKYSNVTERDFSQRPEESGTQSSVAKVLWILVMIVFGVLGIYVVVVLFSVGLGAIFNEQTPEAIQVERPESINVQQSESNAAEGSESAE
jgi:hypothetical protein